ncbi:cAMP-dependent protein kinase catalytic subunit PRKX-like [Babylonia areolata]|uniref:cAMP-dependent protein kinase catalytic subunit PRKX-like n=1 Tax=Babylonia areolata TaxID=304850 RepID=UPI003FD4168D
MASARVAMSKKCGGFFKRLSSLENQKDLEDGGDGEFSLEDLEILATIGTGTFGRVVLIREPECGHGHGQDEGEGEGGYLALKVMSISQVVRLKQVEHIKNERDILASVSHPFIVNMLWSHKDSTFLYMLMEFIPGGELFSYLRSQGRFTTPTAAFYACEIVCALDYLHGRNVVYRDLKPENLLLDKEGHLKITDFGFAKVCVHRTWTLCGTPEYLAPEIILSKGHNKAVDWWSLGVLIFEMLVGYPPFYADNPFGIYEKILSGKVDWPRNIDLVAKDLIKKLLVQDRTRRLGNMKNGAEDIKRHKWFKALDWADVAARKLEAPIVPRLSHDGDTSNFETYDEGDWKKTAPAAEKEVELFEDF